MSAWSFSDLSLRLLFGACALLGMIGCVSQTNLGDAALDAVMKESQLRERSPKTTVWLDNRTGERIREVGMRCTSRTYGTTWTRQTNIGEESEEIWSERYPTPIALVELKLRFDKGARQEYPLNHTCQPGDKVVLVIEKGGRVSVKAK